jgi:regulator of protease activity HflC (stomatin/prohibitin superfamily)
MGISSVIGIVSLLGFLIFLAGVGTVVLATSQNRSPRGGVLLAVVGLVIGILFSVISQGILIVQPNEVAVVFNTLNGNLDTPRQRGTHIIIPVVQQATIYLIQQQEYTMSGTSSEGARSGDDAVRGRTQDGQEVSMDVTVIFGVDPEQVNVVHQRWQNRYIDGFIRPTARGQVRDVVSGFRAAEIYGESRTILEDQIQALLSASLEREGLILSDLLIRDITFSSEFSASIENAQIAQQESEQARLRVTQRQQEAEQARAVAQGQRDAAIAIAEGEAQSIILRARAEAEALRLVSEQLAANPLLIQYQYIQTLGPSVRLAIIPSDSPFLFDFESVAANPDFIAPDVPESSLVLPTPTSLPEPTPGS